MAGRWEPGPALGCRFAPQAPAFYLFTPRHRQVVRRAGYRQGQARPRPRLLLRMQCTGLWLLPVAPASLRLMGYVLDVEQVPCAPQQ